MVFAGLGGAWYSSTRLDFLIESPVLRRLNQPLLRLDLRSSMILPPLWLEGRGTEAAVAAVAAGEMPFPFDGN